MPTVKPQGSYAHLQPAELHHMILNRNIKRAGYISPDCSEEYWRYMASERDIELFDQEMEPFRFFDDIKIYTIPTRYRDTIDGRNAARVRFIDGLFDDDTFFGDATLRCGRIPSRETSQPRYISNSSHSPGISYLAPNDDDGGYQQSLI